jgi:hypothetical protein
MNAMPTEVPDTLTALQPGERQILTIRRHPIGITGLYILCALVTVATAALTFGLSSNSDSSKDQAIIGTTLIFGIVAVICAVVALIATKIYWANIWILTADSLTQVDQDGLFRRKSSQLALEHIEDVTSEQIGMLPRMFNYGVLHVAIPGESNKFVFPLCPNPNYYAARILQAREDFQHYSHDKDSKAPPVEPPIVSYEVPD